MFRIFQEALTNVAKHAEASLVIVTLAKLENHIFLSVEDNGSGFEMHELPESGIFNGIGLINMQEMATFAGGDFFIDSSPGVGTKISVKIHSKIK